MHNNWDVSCKNLFDFSLRDSFVHHFVKLVHYTAITENETTNPYQVCIDTFPDDQYLL